MAEAPEFIKSWSKTNLQNWLETNSCAACVDTFRDEDIDGPALMFVTDDELKELVPKIGPRARIRALISSAKNQESTRQEARQEDTVAPQQPSSQKENETSCQNSDPAENTTAIEESIQKEVEKGTSRTLRERSPSPVQVTLGPRVVRVGTFRGIPIEPIVINKNGFSFCIEGIQGSHTFHIFPQEIEQCLVNFDRTSLMFFLTAQSCGVRTRQDLAIPHHNNPKLPPAEPYFDPSGLDMTHQMITVVMDTIDQPTQLEFQKLMDTYKSFGKQGDEAFYIELSADEANEILKQSTRKGSIQHVGVAPPPVVGDHQYSQQQGEEDRLSRSPSHGMKGTSRTLRERSPSSVQVTLGARVVRVGTFRGIPIEPIVINKNGFSFCIEGIQGSHTFHIFPQEIQQCLVNFDRTSLMFFLTAQSCGVRTRQDLAIPHHNNPKLPPAEPYFDPSGLDMTHQMITVVMDTIDQPTQLEFQKLMDTYKSFGKQGDEAFYMKLSTDEANEIIKQSTRKGSIQHVGVAPPPVVGDHQYSQQQGEEDRPSRSPSPPRIGFVGPIVKLLTYPPPPAKGSLSITNEDLYCLQEGEFLNDIIIDFYLKYLLLEKMSEEDHARTHIFSSFFYKRLTQRIRGAAIDDDPNISLAVKRHAGVKTWTRHVDLFKKDFIIIPINEHSHWFLAIICFPGLQEPVQNKYIPKPVSVALPEAASVPTPPQPTEEANPEEMDMDDAETPVPEGSQVNTPALPADSVSDPKEKETETENKDKPEKMDTDDPKLDSEEIKHALGTTDTTAEKETEASGSDEVKRDSPMETNGSDSVEDKPEAAVETETKADAKSASDGAGRSGTPTSTSSSTSAGTNTAATNTGAQSQKLTLKMGSRGRAVTSEEEEKQENVATGLKQPCIIVFDTLSGPSRSRIVQVLKEYLLVEWSVKKVGTELDRTMIKGCVPKAPQQNNYCDCGVYVLQYVESFFEDPIQDFTIPIKGLHDWFTLPKIEGKREEIHDLIIDLKAKFESKAEQKSEQKSNPS